ncbi:MAG: hypothetical protein KJ044_17255, partial [Planctomycetes bacterium]|nr:hypothetical protein [Planctomycetota bacterium]
SKNDEGVTEYEIASTGFSTKDLEAFYHYDALFDDMFQKGTTLEQHGKELLSYKLADYINETFEKWNDTAISSGATVSFSERDVMLEVDWSSDSKIFSITILASKKIDASNMKKALDKMLETYELGDVVTLAISEEQ